MSKLKNKKLKTLKNELFKKNKLDYKIQSAIRGGEIPAPGPPLPPYDSFQETYVCTNTDVVDDHEGRWGDVRGCF